MLPGSTTAEATKSVEGFLAKFYEDDERKLTIAFEESVAIVRERDLLQESARLPILPPKSAR